MGWNGSEIAKGAAQSGEADSKGEAPSSALEKKRLTSSISPALLKGAFAGLVVVALAAAALYFIFGPARTPPAPETVKKSSAIKEVTPAPAPKAEVVEEKTDTKPRVRKPRKTYVDEKGVLRYEGGMVVRKPPVREIHISDGRPQIFKPK